MSILVRNFEIKKKHIAALFLGISAIVGLVRFILFIIPRSKPEDQLILGLSAARVFLAVIFLGLLLINIGAILFMLMDWGTRQKEFEKKAVDFFSEHHTIIMLALYVVLILVGTFLALMIPPVLRPLRFLISFHIRLGGFLTWIFVADLLLVILIWVIATEVLRTGQDMARVNTFFAFTILLVATFVLYFHTAVSIGWINRRFIRFWTCWRGNLYKASFIWKIPHIRTI